MCQEAPSYASPLVVQHARGGVPDPDQAIDGWAGGSLAVPDSPAPGMTARKGQALCQIGIITDDLSGALDTAAAFASSDDPILVSWAGEPRPARGFALDTETRQASAAVAAETVATLLQHLTPCCVAFKKIDSLMRGNAVAELIACCSAETFRSVVIAPAFPQQRRVTRRGHQYAWIDDQGWRPVGAKIPASLAENGVQGRLVESGAELAGEGVLVCDAESAADLERIAASAAKLAAPILWCGTAGLARALGAPAAGPTIEAGKRLLVVGSRHPVSLRQLARLKDTLGEITWVRHPDGASEAVVAVVNALVRDGRAALAFDLPPLPPDEAEHVFRRAFVRLVRIAAPDLVVVVGGDTVFRLCDEAGATHLEAIGEYAPGIAVSRFVDGAWPGARIVSKSGAFGDDGLLARLMAR